MNAVPRLERGSISPNTQIESVVIRANSGGGNNRRELRLQGRLKNICPCTLDEVKCDLSYFGPNGEFLGLDVTSFLALDDIDPEEIAPFDLELKVPIAAMRCVLNVHSKRVPRDAGAALGDYVALKRSESYWGFRYPIAQILIIAAIAAAGGVLTKLWPMR